MATASTFPFVSNGCLREASHKAIETLDELRMHTIYTIVERILARQRPLTHAFMPKMYRERYFDGAPNQSGSNSRGIISHTATHWQCDAV
jgi:hypothetical protein